MDPHASEIATLTRNYRQLQGLRWVPVGVSCLVAAVVLGNRSLEGALWAILVAAALVLVIGDAWIDRYYARAFGIVSHGPLWRRPGPAAVRVAGFLVAVAAVFVDIRQAWPVLLSGLVFALFMVAFWASTGRRRAHWPILAIIPAVASFAPLIGLPAGRDGLPVVLAAVGVAQVIAGLLDHRSLRARLARLPADGSAGQ